MNETPQPYRSEFVAALEKIAEACSIMQARGQELPILVGSGILATAERPDAAATEIATLMMRGAAI